MARSPHCWAMLAFSSVIACSVARDLQLLFSHAVAVGTDGYYYVLQIRSLQRSGQLQYASSAPLVLHLLSLLCRLAPDIIWGIKIGAVLLHLILGAGLRCLLGALGCDRFFALAGAALLVASKLRLYFMAEFLSHLGALALLVWAGFFFARAQVRGGALPAVLSLVCLLGATYSHRSSWAVVAVLVLGACSLRAIELLSQGRRWIPAFMVLLGCWAGPFCLSRLKLAGRFPLLSAELMPRPSLRIFNDNHAEWFVLALAAPLALWSVSGAQVAESRAERAQRSFCGGCAIFALAVTLNPFLNHEQGLIGVTGRLSILAHLQAAVIVPLLIWSWRDRLKNARACLLAVILLSAIAGMAGEVPKGIGDGFLRARARLIAGLERMEPSLPPESIVLAPHGDQFIVTAVLGVAAQQRWPGRARAGPAYWLLHRFPRRLASPAEVISEGERETATVLISERALRSAARSLTAAERRALLAANTHLRLYSVAR